MEKVKAFMEYLGSPEGLELLRGKGKPSGPADACKVYAELAQEKGFDVSADDIAAYVRSQSKDRKEKTDAAAEAVERVADDEMDRVAGGGDYPECKDTFKQRENCWSNDGCDVANNHYKYYACHHLYHAVTPIPCSSTTWD